MYHNMAGMGQSSVYRRGESDIAEQPRQSFYHSQGGMDQNRKPGDVQMPGVYSFLGHSHRDGAGESAANFVKRRDEDLNVTIIVAGLISAVATAFIVYVQPQLQMDRTVESAELLRVLIYQTNNTAFGGQIPEGPKPWTGPPSTVISALVLLYLSLASAMGSVLLAILVKQLLNLYTFASISESDIENGQSQQLRWFTVNLHVVVLLLSIMVQLSLLFLNWAGTIYVWNTNRTIGLVILCATAGILPVYLTFVTLAVVNLGLLHRHGARDVGRRSSS